MAVSRRILFCFLAFKTISATCSSDRTFTIRDTADTSALAICPTYTGDIAVGVNMLGIVSLPKLETLHGSLMLYNNLGLSALRADSLSRINGQLIVQNAQNLSTLALPKLSQVGDLVLDSLPKLAELTIDVQNASNIYIGANQILGNTTLHVTEISQNFTLFKNGDQLKEFSMPDLDVIDGDFLAACNSHLAELELTSLEHVEKTMNVQGNPAMASLVIPELESVEGGLWTDSILDAPKLEATGAVTDAPNPRTLDCTVMRANSLPTLSLLTSNSLERADLDASRYSTNPDLTINTRTNPNLNPGTTPNVSVNANTNTNTNIQPTQNAGVSTLTKAMIAMNLVAGIVLAGAIALCRFQVKRRLDKSWTGEGDEEEVKATEAHSVAKDGSKTVPTSAAITSLETTSSTTLRMTALGLLEIPKAQKSNQSAKFRPVQLATPIALATQPSPLPIDFVAATPCGNTRLNDDRNSETEGKGELDRKARSRSKSRGRQGQDLDRADTAQSNRQSITENTGPGMDREENYIATSKTSSTYEKYLVGLELYVSKLAGAQTSLESVVLEPIVLFSS